MENDEKVMVVGEDILDPYGGAFKVTKGLSNKYPDRVIGTPISEAGIIGLGIGLALQGFKPIVEIMFGDFMSLTIDQILNSGSKFSLMYGDDVTVPLIVRTPMGGARGYGPTHSQSIEKLFFGMPGISVVSPSIAHNPGDLLVRSSGREQITIFIEGKEIYTTQLFSAQDGELKKQNLIIDDNEIAIVDNFMAGEPDICIFSYGAMSSAIISVMKQLIDDEICIRALFPEKINHLGFIEHINDFVDPVYGCLICEPGTQGFGWNSEILKNLYQYNHSLLNRKINFLSSENSVIPASKTLEDNALVTEQDMIESIVALME